MVNSQPPTGPNGTDGFTFGSAPNVQPKVDQSSTISGPRLRVRPGDGYHNNRSYLRDKDELDNAYVAWANDPTPANMSSVMGKAGRDIDSAVTSYAPNSAPAVRSKAKILLKRAIESYDPSQARLRTHIHNQLRPLGRESNSYNTLHVPERVSQDLSYLHEWTQRFKEEKGHDPSDMELADFSKLSKKRIAHIRRYDKNQVFEGTRIGSQSGDEDVGAGTEALRVSEAADLWEDYVYDGLSKQDKLVYDLKTGKGNAIPRSVNEIAERLKITASAVSQRLKNIATKIQEGAELRL